MFFSFFNHNSSLGFICVVDKHASARSSYMQHMWFQFKNKICHDDISRRALLFCYVCVSVILLSYRIQTSIVNIGARKRDNEEQQQNTQTHREEYYMLGAECEWTIAMKDRLTVWLICCREPLLVYAVVFCFVFFSLCRIHLFFFCQLQNNNARRDAAIGMKSAGPFLILALFYILNCEMRWLAEDKVVIRRKHWRAMPSNGSKPGAAILRANVCLFLSSIILFFLIPLLNFNKKQFHSAQFNVIDIPSVPQLMRKVSYSKFAFNRMPMKWNDNQLYWLRSSKELAGSSGDSVEINLFDCLQIIFICDFFSRSIAVLF